MSRQDARRFIVAYDVADDRRRNRVARVLEQFGDRVQYSVFVVDLGASGVVRMKAKVVDVIKKDEDSVLICDLGPVESAMSSRFSYLGRTRPVTSTDGFVV